MAESESTITCQCGAINFKADLKLPVKTEFCYCNPCRQTTGAQFLGFTALRDRPPASALANCSSYASSKDLDRYFCSTCGTKLFIHVHREEKKDRWSCLAGAVDPPKGTENVIDVEMNEFVEDTVDGGLAPFMTNIGGREIPIFATAESHGKRISKEKLEKMTAASKNLPLPGKDETLTAECHCGCVSVRIKPADDLDASIPAPPSPHYFKSPEKNKYMPCTCVCRDCRLH